ncbi:MAG: helix-turn-helix transcriptional regulator, partial [Bacteroidia bacterium]
SRQALIDRNTAIGLSYIDSLIKVYVSGLKVEKLNAAIPLWCAFNRNSGIEKASLAPLSKIDSAELNAFIKTEIKKDLQIEKRIEFCLLSKSYTWLERKVSAGELDTNKFTNEQKAVYYLLIGKGHYYASKYTADKLVPSLNKSLHYSQNNHQLDYISRSASHLLGVYYFGFGAIEKALYHFKNRADATLNINYGKVLYLKGYSLYQNNHIVSAQTFLDIGMCYEKLGKLIEGIDYYERALTHLERAKRPHPSVEYWAKSLLINSYFDFENSARATELFWGYLTEIDGKQEPYERWRYLHHVFRELNYHDIEESSKILDTLLFSKPKNAKMFEPKTVVSNPKYDTYIEQAGLISVMAMVQSFNNQKLNLNDINTQFHKLIDLHNENVSASSSKTRGLKSLQCLQFAWRIATQNKQDAAKSQNRLKTLFANEDSLHYFAYNAKLTTYILKLNGNHAQEIELLQLLMPRYIKGNYVVELQKLYLQLSEAYEAIGQVEKSYDYFKLSDSLKQQSQQLNHAAQLALFDKKLEVSKTITEKKLLEKENETLKVRRNWLILLVVSAGVVICLLGLLFQAKRKRHKLLVSQKQLELQLLEKDVSDKNTQLENTTLQLLKSNTSFAKLFEEMNQLSTNLNAENKKKARSALLDHKSVLEDDIWEQFKLQFQKTNAAFFTKLKAHNPDLTDGELRICAMHVSNLSSKEIAAITGQQIRSIYTLKSRIRKKLDVQDDVELLEKLKGIGAKT